MEEIAERIVADIEPSGGWWKDDTQSSLQDAAVDMLVAGMDEDDVENVLHKVTSALREEYGE